MKKIVIMLGIAFLTLLIWYPRQLLQLDLSIRQIKILKMLWSVVIMHYALNMVFFGNGI